MKTLNKQRPSVKNNKTSVLLTELFQKGATKKITTNTYAQDFNFSGSSKELQAKKTSFVPTEFVIIRCGLLKMLDVAETKMVAEITDALKRKNLFWEYDYLAIGGKYAVTFRSLCKKQILIKTDNPIIHIVNPYYIRRGDITQIIIASLNRIRENDHIIDTNLIIHLDRKSDTGSIDPFDELRVHSV